MEIRWKESLALNKYNVIFLPKNCFDFSCFGSGLGTLDISKEQNWPKASTLSLDDSQYGAFVTAMKSKLALIQGPPGSKTTKIKTFFTRRRM
jgi:hypothetical protein